MAESDDRVVIEITLDDGKVIKGFANIEKGAKKSGKDIDKSFSDAFRAPLKSLLSLKSAILGIGATLAAGFSIREVVRAASQQEDAVNKLNTQLALAGDFSKEASQSMQDFASELQKTTKFGDETTLQMLALAKTFRRSNEETQKLVLAATELSSAMGMSLDSAVKKLGKTFSGLTGQLGESLPMIRGLTAEQLRSGAALDLILQRFGGSAAAQVKTFSGGLQQLSNSWGDLKEEIGFVITQNQAVVNVINQVNKIISESSAEIRGNRQAYKELIAEGIITSINVIRLLAKELLSIGTAFQSLGTKIGGFAASASFALEGEFKLAREAWSLTSKELDKIDKNYNDRVALIESGFKSISDAAKGGLDAIKKGMESIPESANVAKQAIHEVSEEQKQQSQQGLELANKLLSDSRTVYEQQLSQLQEARNAQKITEEQHLMAVKALWDQYRADEQIASIDSAMNWENWANALKVAANEIRITFKSIAASMTQTMAQGAGQAFAAFGRAIAKGENALEAFANQLLATMGNMAVQLGTQFILQGIAYSWAGMPNGPPLIAAGSALAAFGGILSALGGGEQGSKPGATPENATGGGVTNQPSATTDFQDDDIERQQRTEVRVNVQGSIFDTDETGLRIARILNDAFDSHGVIVARGNA